MRTRFTTLLATFAMTLAAVVPATAHADIDGTAAVIQSINITTAGSNGYAANHVWVLIGTVPYYSGGTVCSGVPELTTADLERLNLALVNGLMVNPGYLEVGDYRCLTVYRIYAP